MIDAAVGQVRSFNRLVTQRVGALNDHYLARERPLGEARLLWEIGAEGSDVRKLRSRLDLDSGYLSRLLRSLEAAKLIRVEPNKDDKRVRTVRLTPAGRAERDLLERRSDELARSFLEPLGEARRQRLVAAMAEVERLLTAGLVEIDVVDPAHRDAQLCARVLHRPRPAFRLGVRSCAEHLRRAPRAEAAGGAVPRRDLARRARWLRRVEVPRRPTDGAQAHVGLRVGA